MGSWTVGTPSATGSVSWKYKQGNWVYWVPITVTQQTNNSVVPAGTWYKVPVYSNYSMSPGQTISLSVSHVMPTDFNGVKVTNSLYNYMTIQAYKSGSLVEQQVLKVWIPTDGIVSFTATPALTYLGAVGLYTFTITPNVAVNAGDFISVEFTTYDNYYTWYQVDLGRTFSTTSFNIGCRELDGNNLISDSRLTCKLYKGSAASKIPAVIQVAVTKSIPAGTLLTFVVLDIKNPSGNIGPPVGITGKVLRSCDTADSINLCAIFKSTTYIYMTGSNSLTNAGTYTMTPSPTIVSATSATHTFTRSVALNVGDYLRLNYYPEVIVPATCTVAGHSCWTFPL